jgi:hypothetical protein
MIHFYAWYGANNDWIGTALHGGDYKSLPPAINTTINDKFRAIPFVCKREMKKGQMAYELQLKKGDEDVNYWSMTMGISLNKTVDKLGW